MSNKRITCKTCKRTNLTLAADGECGRCYARRKAGKDPITNEPVSAASKPVTAPQINVESTLNYGAEPAAPPEETSLTQAPEKPASKRSARPYPTQESVTLTFATTRDADLFAKLQSMAITHRRTLEAEIMFQLEERSMQIEDVYLSILDK